MRVFILALVIILSALVTTLVPIGALVLIHHYTKQRSAFWAWAVASAVWLAMAMSVINSIVNDSGLAKWAAS